MTVTDNAIRIQLPGGAIYAPALAEAASKAAARSGHPSPIAERFVKLCGLAVASLNGGGATSIVFEMAIHDDGLDARLTGRGAEPTRSSLTALDKAASKSAKSCTTKATKSAFTISFEV